ncbi:MAG: hypothetical protein WC494_03700 [Candidatus Pacearchaeota archaeon]
MKSNAQIHVYVTTELKEKLRKEAIEKDLSFSQLCRRKLGEDRLIKIEEMLEKLVKKDKQD